MKKKRSKGNRFAGLARGERRQRGVMNKTETLYSLGLESDPQVVSWKHEAIKLRVTYPVPGNGFNSMWYTPDFLVVAREMDDDGNEFHRIFLDEIKGDGPVNDASIVRLKAAAELHPQWTFRLATKLPKRDGGGFDRRTV